MRWQSSWSHNIQHNRIQYNTAHITPSHAIQSNPMRSNRDAKIYSFYLYTVYSSRFDIEFICACCFCICLCLWFALLSLRSAPFVACLSIITIFAFCRLTIFIFIFFFDLLFQQNELVLKNVKSTTKNRQNTTHQLDAHITLWDDIKKKKRISKNGHRLHKHLTSLGLICVRLILIIRPTHYISYWNTCAIAV